MDLDAIKQRAEERRTLGGRHPDVHPTLLAMEQDIDDLVAEVARATDLAERYGEAIVKISAALVADDLNPGGRIMRARGVIAGLGEQDG